MAYKQNAPSFDAAAIRAKRKNVNGVKVPSKDRAIGLGSSEGPKCKASTPSSLPKHHRTKSGTVMSEIRSSTALIPDTSSIPKYVVSLIGSSTHPLPFPGLVFSDIIDPWLKDASQFTMEFDGDAGIPITSIYDRRFLNKVFIDQNLNLPTDKEKHEKIELLGLLFV